MGGENGRVPRGAAITKRLDVGVFTCGLRCYVDVLGW